MNTRPLTPLLFALSTFWLSSCAEKNQPKPDPKPAESRLVGRVASIHQNGSFVLIQSYGLWKIETGAILASLGANGRSANLRVTGEKTGQFAAADIQSGTLEVGDGVYTTLSTATDQPDEFELPQPNGQSPAAPQP